MKNKKTKDKSVKTPKHSFKNAVYNIRILIIVWASVFAIIATLFIVSFFVGDGDQKPWFDDSFSRTISIVISFAAFAVSSLFSFSILSHNAVTRDMNEEMKKSSNEVNARGESFRTLQYISSNYSVVDFVDFMLLYEEPDRYTSILRNSKNFQFYLREDDVDIMDVVENFDDYRFITVKIPIKIIEGKTISKIRFTRFKFVKEGTSHLFVACAGNNNSLIIHNENDHRDEVIVNLIMKNDSAFYPVGEVVNFLKIKISLTMQSLLGVSVKGWIELYFTNPLKLEEGGGNKYKINSSQFEVSGLPVLQNSVGEELDKI